MAEKTAISWTDATWSPWEGCTKVSPGCENCYAAGMNNWLRKGANWGPGAPRREYSVEHWRKPLRWNHADFRACSSCGWRGERFKSAPAGCPACGALSTVPALRRVFPSVCDPFDNEVSNTRRAEFLSLIYATPNLTWQLLTKRIGNVARLMEECTEPGKKWELPPNVWLGATVVNQEEANRDIPKLLAAPVRVRFLSIEPMLGPVDLTHIRLPLRGESFETANVLWHKDAMQRGAPRAALDWVICGGESGRSARPADPAWFDSLRQQCAAAGVAFHMKQITERGRPTPIDTWPAELRVQEFPS